MHPDQAVCKDRIKAAELGALMNQYNWTLERATLDYRGQVADRAFDVSAKEPSIQFLAGIIKPAEVRLTIV